MGKIQSEKQNSWEFPAVDLLVWNSDLLGLNQIDDTNNRKNKSLDIIAHVTNMIDQRFNSKINIAFSQIENLKNEYEKKIEFIQQLLQKLENPLAVFDKELIVVILDIIKKSIKKLVYKEIRVNPKSLNEMIKKLKKEINTQGNLVKVYLSEKDYNRLSMSGLKSIVDIHINPELTVGDIVIKTDLTETRAILAERVDKLIGVDND